MKKLFTFLCLSLVVLAAQSQMRYFKGILQGSQEVPATPSTASGVVIIKYNTVTRLLELAGNYQGLTAAANASHIHSPAAAGSNAPVLITLTNTGGTTGAISGTATLTPADETNLYGGLMYVNVHNSNYPSGEIRAQLSASTVGQTDYFNGRLQGAQQSPPNNSTGNGSVMVLVDKTLDSVYLTGNFTGLSATATAAHIHNAGIPGVNGPVFQNLVFSNATSGTLHVAAPITDANQAEMLNGTTYVNIHNAPFPGGEIRAQLTKFSQFRFLKATLQGSQEVPANSSAGVGTIIVRYNSETRALDLVGDYQNISTAITASHIHSPAAPGSNAPVLINLTNTGGTSGTLTGSATITAVDESNLLGGLMYVNVHNSNFPNGEIRGQLTVNAGESELMTGIMIGAQEVPANSSTGNGFVTVLLDKAASRVYTTGTFSGLTVAATAGHIHSGLTGTTGPVIVPLSVTAAKSGTITGSATVSAGFADSLIKGFTYVNIHNATYPGGEIRAQLGDLVLPLKLNYFNGYKTASNVTLIWETAQEINLRQFEIEQQDANGNWVKKSVVSANGGSSVTKYQTEDNPLSVKTEYTLYRLKMVDADGRFSYSPVIRIGLGKQKAALNLNYNPITNGVLSFTISGIENSTGAEAVVMDYGGRIVVRTKTSPLQNTRIDVSTLSKGMYRLIVTLNGTTLQESFSKY